MRCYYQLPRIIIGEKLLETLKRERKGLEEKYLVEKINKVLDKYIKPAVIYYPFVIDVNNIKFEELLNEVNKEIEKNSNLL